MTNPNRSHEEALEANRLMFRELAAKLTADELADHIKGIDSNPYARPDEIANWMQSHHRQALLMELAIKRDQEGA